MREKNVACYIVNTGDFMGHKVQKEDTLGILETIVEGKAAFEKWGPFEDIEIMNDWSGKTGDFTPDLKRCGLCCSVKGFYADKSKGS